MPTELQQTSFSFHDNNSTGFGHNQQLILANYEQ
jgi:hypothetical protein